MKLQNKYGYFLCFFYKCFNSCIHDCTFTQNYILNFSIGSGQNKTFCKRPIIFKVEDLKVKPVTEPGIKRTSTQSIWYEVVFLFVWFFSFSLLLTLWLLVYPYFKLFENMTVFGIFWIILNQYFVYDFESVKM